jgi:hypothetical protein
MWEECISLQDIEDIFVKLRQDFSDLKLKLTADEMKADQFIRQGETDCVGVCLRLDDITQDLDDTTPKLIVDKIYAVDIAFLEYGLNYGDTNERIRKKYIRTALTLYQYFGIKKDVEIIFATPKTSPSQINILKELAINVKEIFNNHGFNYDFKFYGNNDFYTSIYKPVYEHIEEIADTSELFIRSAKLIDIVNSFKNENNGITTTKSIESNKFSKATELKIGITAKTVFGELSKKNTLSSTEIENLCNSEYSRKILGLQFPALVKYNNDDSVAFDKKGRRRYYKYYKDTYKLNGQKYLLCNDWYERNRNLLENWYNKIIKLC